MEAVKFAIYNRIVFWIVVPVIFVAVTISTLFIYYLSPPLNAFLTNQFEANLRLATNMGLRICQSNFSYLLDLRLEDNIEMNLALKKEVLAQVKELSNQVPAVHLMVVDEERTVQTWSLEKSFQNWDMVDVSFKNDSLVGFEIDGEKVKAHILYFPFWGWYIVSFVYEKDYLSPINRVHRIINLSLAGVFATVFITLLAVYHLFVNRPLQRLISAAQDVTRGEFSPIAPIANNEIGQLMSAFNSMIVSLASEKAEVRHLINQLRISESQLRTLFETAPLGICVTTKKGRIIRANQSMVQMVGLSTEGIKRSNFVDLFKEPAQAKSLLASVTKQETIENFETTLKLKDGITFSVRMILTMIILDKQQVIFAIIEDVTQQNKLESQLNQSRKLEAIGSLAGGVAHDFNNLLTPILGYSELLLINLEPADKDFEWVQSISTAAKRARGIVRQLLAFSRRQTLEIETIDLNMIITDFFSLLHRTIREDIIIEKVLNETISSINADSGQIEQILMNLAVNAQDAMPIGGRLIIETDETELDEIYTSKHKSVLPGQYVMLAVSDTGHGMDSNTLAKIFDPFFTTKEKGRGTGFGLATVYGIVKQHGGNIWAYSEVGEGTTIKIYFPVADDKIEQPRKVTEPSYHELPATETILVVEDDPSVLMMSISILENQNYHILSASNPNDALQMASEYKEPIDLLLTDVVMPGMNGRELYTGITGYYPDIKVIYMSGYTNNVIAHHGILDQGIVFIQKPFSINNLITKVRLVLDSS